MDPGGSRWILLDSAGSISTVSLCAGNQDADPWWILLVDPDGFWLILMDPGDQSLRLSCGFFNHLLR